jgi:hypothetical protein
VYCLVTANDEGLRNFGDLEVLEEFERATEETPGILIVHLNPIVRATPSGAKQKSVEHFNFGRRLTQTEPSSFC